MRDLTYRERMALSDAAGDRAAGHGFTVAADVAESLIGRGYLESVDGSAVFRLTAEGWDMCLDLISGDEP